MTQRSTHGSKDRAAFGRRMRVVLTPLAVVGLTLSCDTLVIGNADAAHTVVLLDGAEWIPSRCLADHVRGYDPPVSGTLSVWTGNLLAASAGCTPELAVFSTARAVLIDPSPEWRDSWLDRDVVRRDLTEPLGVAVSMWVPTGDVAAKEFAQDEILLAEAVYLEDHAGLKLPWTLGEASADLLGKGCADVPALQARGPPIYLSGQLNVYMVEKIVVETSGSYSYAGRFCPPNVIYVSIPEHLSLILAHEIGHSLSLRHTGAGNIQWGGFTNTNLMLDDPTNAASAAPGDRITLGQAFRATVDPQSWLNMVVAGAAIRAGGVVRDCQDAWDATNPCPKESLAWP